LIDLINGSIDHATLDTLLNPTLADTLQEFSATYLTARRKNPHWFCKNCGSTLGTDLAWLMENILVNEEPRVTINLRMLKDIRIRDLKIEKREGMREH
jgi:hypothetical protein